MPQSIARGGRMTTNAVDEYDDFLDEGGPRWRKRLIMLALAAVVVGAVFFVVWATLMRGSGSSAAQTQTTTVQLGSIVKSISTSATTASQSTANLSFGQSGKVTAVNVKVSQAVKQGDILATVESQTLQDAVTRAQVNLNSAQAKLTTLLEGSTTADLASADQAVIQAQANLEKANTALQDLYNPTADSVNSAQQAVLSAQSQLTKAQQARTAVDTNWSDAVSAAETAVDKAKSAKSDDADALDLAQTNLESAESVYEACSGKEYSGSLGTPLSSSAQSALSSEASEGTASCSSEASKVLSANNSYKSAETAYNNAVDALDTAKDNLSELGSAPDSNDVSVADAAVQSAQLALTSANDKLAELGNPSNDDVTQAQHSADAAAAALTAAEAKRDDTYQGSKPADISAQQDQVRLAQISVDEAKKGLEDAQLSAPFDGTVAAVNINVGDTAGSGSSSSSTSTSAAIVLNTPNALVLNVSVGESDLPNVKAGQSGTATFDAITGTIFPIVIDSVGTNATTTQGVVTYQAKAHIVNGQTAASTQPSPGMNASVTITIDQAQNVLTVPSSTIQRDGRNSVVNVRNDDGSTARQTVETGLTNGTLTEITSGLEEGQTVIIPGATASTTTSSSSSSQGTNSFFGGSSSGSSSGGGFPGGPPGGD
jgi:multidrug efflux pump subunit AcrA (membrane-fusion protein)